MNPNRLDKLQQKLNLRFTNKALLMNAFVHRSYLNEIKRKDLSSNERLEFLGDACLELIVSEHLYQNYPQEPEGVLTNYRAALVNTSSLAETARQLDLGRYLLLSKGEEEGGGRESEHLLANTFEALIGALYLDQGYRTTQEFVKKHLLPKLPEIIRTGAYRDAKSVFQEIAQEKTSITPHYQVLEEWGPDHDKNFRVGVFLGRKKIAEGTGSSKQKAEISAAENALKKWSQEKTKVW